MIIDVHRHIGTGAQVLEGPDAVGLLHINQNQPCDLRQIYVFQSSDPEIVYFEETADVILRTSGKGQHGAGVQFPSGHHGRQPVKIRIEMGRNEIHAEILAGMERAGKQRQG
jgi:hypothetical protein